MTDCVAGNIRPGSNPRIASLRFAASRNDVFLPVPLALNFLMPWFRPPLSGLSDIMTDFFRPVKMAFLERLL